VPCVITFALIAAKPVTVGGKVLKAHGSRDVLVAMGHNEDP
jgi:hypothetical protein